MATLQGGCRPRRMRSHVCWLTVPRTHGPSTISWTMSGSGSVREWSTVHDHSLGLPVVSYQRMVESSRTLPWHGPR